MENLRKVSRFFFSAKAIYDELFFKRFRVSVSHDGLVNWVPGGKFVTSCQLDITFYPFDDQVCHIDLVDWAYHGLQVSSILRKLETWLQLLQNISS